MDSQFDVASMKLLTVELGSQVNFCLPSLFGLVLVGGDGPNANSWTRATNWLYRLLIQPSFSFSLHLVSPVFNGLSNGVHLNRGFVGSVR